MTEYRNQILNATPEKLRIMVAKKLGWLTLSQEHSAWYMVPPNKHKSYATICPNWPNSIAWAWKLDGDGWHWHFAEHPDRLSVDVYTPEYNTMLNVACALREPWHNTKEETYAIARCRAWLLAKEKSDAKH